jgi:microcystin degradation protein MlrC
VVCVGFGKRVEDPATVRKSDFVVSGEELQNLEAISPERGVQDPPLRVLVAGLSHQTNRFAGGRTGLGDFEITRGEEMLQTHDASPFAGVVEVGRERGWELLPTLNMRALPGPTVSDAVIELFWAEFRAVAEAVGGIDGVFVVLHGSMVSESYDDVEGEVLRRMRGVGGLSDAPICGVFDLHANFTEAMARQSDGLISFRSNPCTDAREAARDAALLLDRLMRTGERPATVWEHPPIMLPPSAAATDHEPMRSLEGRARRMEALVPELLAVNVCAGFPYADVPEVGVSFSAVTIGDLEVARAATRELNVLASAMRSVANPSGMPLEEAALLLEGHDEGPVLLVEPSDCVEAGAPGDATRVLRMLVERRVPNSGVVINDPEAVSLLWDSRQGERRKVEVGGKSGGIGAEPLPLTVEVLSRSEGRFPPENRRSRFAHLPGGVVEMGPCVVVRHRGVTVLLTSRRTPPFDLGQWRSQGVDPEGFFAVGVKSALEHCPAYDPIARASYVVDLPGPCTENFGRLPFKHVSRPVFPLDDL